MAMTFGSLFAGIGGFDLGLEWAGMECRWQVEINDFCQKVLAKHWPNVRRYGDVKDCGHHNLEAVDLICGGFPCQPVSVAGKRKGEADERWLWPEFHRIIRELNPRWVLVENVPGLLSTNSGRLFGGILRDLAASGYDAEWDSIPAAAVGAPHLRYRVFIVAYPSQYRDRCQQDKQGNSRLQQDSSGWPRVGDELGNSSQALAYAHTERWDRRPRVFGTGRRAELTNFCRTIGAAQWAVEPDVGRLVNGLPSRVDRIRGLGNTVVPQVAEWIGRRIMAGAGPVLEPSRGLVCLDGSKAPQGPDQGPSSPLRPT